MTISETIAQISNVCSYVYEDFIAPSAVASVIVVFAGRKYTNLSPVHTFWVALDILGMFSLLFSAMRACDFSDKLERAQNLTEKDRKAITILPIILISILGGVVMSRYMIEVLKNTPQHKLETGIGFFIASCKGLSNAVKEDAKLLARRNPAANAVH